jgi:tetratricopeptide (TPR) repeat protein
VRLLISLAVLGLSLPALAEQIDPDTEVARRHFERGSQLYEQQKYDEAINEFDQARQLKPLPAFDYNIARCHDRMGRWSEALAAYRRYIEAAPNEPDSDSVRERIKVLEPRVAQPAHPPPSTAVVAPPPTAAPSRPVPRGGAKVIAGAVVAVVGLGLVGAGGGYAAMASDAADRLTAADRAMATFDASQESAYKLDRTVEGALLGIGIAAVAAGVVVLAIGAREMKPRPAERASR